jgi:hypothetical protein
LFEQRLDDLDGLHHLIGAHFGSGKHVAAGQGMFGDLQLRIP